MRRWLLVRWHRLLRHRIDWYGYGTAYDEGYCSCGHIWLRKRARVS